MIAQQADNRPKKCQPRLLDFLSISSSLNSRNSNTAIYQQYTFTQSPQAFAAKSQFQQQFRSRTSVSPQACTTTAQQLPCQKKRSTPKAGMNPPSKTQKPNQEVLPKKKHVKNTSLSVFQQHLQPATSIQSKKRQSGPTLVVAPQKPHTQSTIIPKPQISAESALKTLLQATKTSFYASTATATQSSFNRSLSHSRSLTRSEIDDPHTHLSSILSSSGKVQLRTRTQTATSSLQFEQNTLNQFLNTRKSCAEINQSLISTINPFNDCYQKNKHRPKSSLVVEQSLKPTTKAQKGSTTTISSNNKRKLSLLDSFMLSPQQKNLALLSSRNSVMSIADFAARELHSKSLDNGKSIGNSKKVLSKNNNFISNSNSQNSGQKKSNLAGQIPKPTLTLSHTKLQNYLINLQSNSIYCNSVTSGGSRSTECADSIRELLQQKQQQNAFVSQHIHEQSLPPSPHISQKKPFHKDTQYKLSTTSLDQASLQAVKWNTSGVSTNILKIAFSNEKPKQNLKNVKTGITNEKQSNEAISQRLERILSFESPKPSPIHIEITQPSTNANHTINIKQQPLSLEELNQIESTLNLQQYQKIITRQTNNQKRQEANKKAYELDIQYLHEYKNHTILNDDFVANAKHPFQARKKTPTVSNISIEQNQKSIQLSRILNPQITGLGSIEDWKEKLTRKTITVLNQSK